MTEQEMDALLLVAAYDCRKGNAADHYWWMFESHLDSSRVTLRELKRAIVSRLAVVT